MNKTFRKILILPLLLGMIACNGNGNDSSSSSSKVPSTPTTTTSSVSSQTPSTPTKEEWTIYFLYNYEGSKGEFTHSYVLDGEKATAPYQSPTRPEHRFTDWYKDAECTELFDFENTFRSIYSSSSSSAEITGLAKNVNIHKDNKNALKSLAIFFILKRVLS